MEELKQKFEQLKGFIEDTSDTTDDSDDKNATSIVRRPKIDLDNLLEKLKSAEGQAALDLNKQIKIAKKEAKQTMKELKKRAKEGLKVVQGLKDNIKDNLTSTIKNAVNSDKKVNDNHDDMIFEYAIL